MVTSYNTPTLFVDDDIELQVLQPRHASALLGLIQANRRHLKRFLEPVDDICSISDVLEYIQDGLESYEEDRAMAQFGIFYCGELVGCIGYSRLKSDLTADCPEIVFWLGEKYQGHGIIMRSAARVLDYVLLDHGLPRLEVHCAEDNVRSRRIAEKLGFLQDYSRSLFGVLVYTLEAEDWERRRRKRWEE